MSVVRQGACLVITPSTSGFVSFPDPRHQEAAVSPFFSLYVSPFSFSSSLFLSSFFIMFYLSSFPFHFYSLFLAEK
jgi:hypothetical protein